MPWRKRDSSSVIRKGDIVPLRSDTGEDRLYIVQSGEVDCFKTEGNSKEFWKTFMADETFGEFPFLFSLPKKVTLIARSSCILYTLSRELYTFLIKQHASEKNRIHENFLGRLDFYAVLDPEEQHKVLDTVHEVSVREGQIVLKKGESLNNLFIISSGTVTVMSEEGKVIRWKGKEREGFTNRRDFRRTRLYSRGSGTKKLCDNI
jgi:CRP-like cAMP-binding protein